MVEYQHLPTVLTINHLDPTGGSGIQADTETLAALGCHGMAIVTKLNVQDTVGPKMDSVTDTTLLIAQIRALLEDVEVAAIKLGSLGNSSNVEAIHTILNDYPNIPVVFDPSMRGFAAMNDNDGLIDSLFELVLPLSNLVMANRREIQELAPAGDTLQAQASQLIDQGCQGLMVSGGQQRTNPIINRLFLENGQCRELSWQRQGSAFHGVGCTLSAAATAFIAHGASIQEAVEQAQHFVQKTLIEPFAPGMGQPIPNRFHWLRK